MTGIIEANPDWFPWRDENKRRSAAFVLLCMSAALDEPIEDCIELLTEGGDDAGVDGLHMGDIEGGEFQITIFQGKYRVADLEGQANFPANSVQKAVDTVGVLFDPYRPVALNEKIAPRIEEARSLIRDGYVPNVEVVLCNNGARWVPAADTWVEDAERNYGAQVQFRHLNHDAVVEVLRRGDKIDATLALSGQVIVEDMNFMRVMVGRISVDEIARLFADHGDQVLQRNIRRYLGPANRVNQDIRETLLDDTETDRFYFYNNGITMVCDRFAYNAMQQSDHQVQVKNLQIVNGGQTCKTIEQTLRDRDLSCATSAFVMVRIYQIPEESDEVVREITKATNSQTPVDLRDLRSNDEIQQTLALGMADLGYTYKRHRDESRASGDVVTSATVAEAVLAVWRERPHQAKFSSSRAVRQVLRLDLRRAQCRAGASGGVDLQVRPTSGARTAPSVRRTSCPMHRIICPCSSDVRCWQTTHWAPADISHRNFAALSATLKDQGDRYYGLATESLQSALARCYGDRTVSLQQLAATFRRGDLLEMLPPDAAES